MKILSLLVIAFDIICYAETWYEYLPGISPPQMFSESRRSSDIDISVVFLNSRPYRPDAPNAISLTCNISRCDGKVWWTAGETNLTDPVEAVNESEISTTLKIGLNIKNDTGNFTCVAKTTGGIIMNRTIHIGKIVPAKMIPGKWHYDVRVNESATLSCDVEGYPFSEITWVKIENHFHNTEWMNMTKLTYINETYVRMSIDFKIVTREDEGSYICRARDYYDNTVLRRLYLNVEWAPLVKIDLVIPVGSDAVYFRFVIDNSHENEGKSTIQYLKNGTVEWRTETAIYDVEVNSFVLSELEKNTAYKFKFVFVNSVGNSDPVYIDWVRTWEEEPEFVPNVWIEATTLDSIKIGWSETPPSLQFYLSYYQVIGSHQNEASNVENSTFIFEHLRRETNYTLKVRACNFFTRKCCGWSPGIEAVTIDRDLKFVPNVSVEKTTLTSITVIWSSPPLEMRDKVHQYKAVAIHRNHRREPVYLPKNVNFYVFENLESASTYVMKVAACSEYQTQCGDWSLPEEGFTRDDEKTAPVQKLPILIVTIVLSIVVATWIGIRRRRQKALRQKLMKAALERCDNEALDCLNPELNICDQAELLPYNKKWEFPRELLKLDKIIGSGAFGIVRKAQAQFIRRPDTVTTVAVKLVRATARLNYMTALDRELKILGYLGKHLNVVNLLGACTQNINYGELLVIVEFCRFGNLRDYLIRRRDDFSSQIDTTSAVMITADSNASSTHSGDTLDNTQSSNDENEHVVDLDPVTDAIEPVRQSKYQGDYREEDLEPIETRDLLCWIWQVSRGMKFLGSRRVIHGDLAARNILLADHNVVKICDFGMAKALQGDEDYKKKGHDPLPVKWMAIESLGDRVFSYQSDIWSFGIVLWEFFTLGATPYPGIDPGSLYQKLKDGFRMERPKYATEEIYYMMQFCWDADPARRPSFEQLEDILVDLLDESVKTHYIDLGQPYVQMNDDALSHGETDYLTMKLSRGETSNDTIEETQA